MLVSEGLEPVEDLFLLRRELHRAELGQSSQRPLLWARLDITCRPVRENNDLGRPFREIVREPDLDSMVFLNRHLHLMSMHGQPSVATNTKIVAEEERATIPPAMRTRLVNPAVSAILALALVAALGCGERPAGSAEPGHTYTVRGQVTQLPDPRSPGSGLYVSHEPVDNYVGRSGEVEGMDSMNMPFLVAEGVSLDEIAPGDVIEFDLHVDWQADRSVEITRVRELPPGTKLDFRLARPDKQDNEKKE